jgi:hypothetical protein
MMLDDSDGRGVQEKRLKNPPHTHTAGVGGDIIYKYPHSQNIQYHHITLLLLYNV